MSKARRDELRDLLLNGDHMSSDEMREFAKLVKRFGHPERLVHAGFGVSARLGDYAAPGVRIAPSLVAVIQNQRQENGDNQ
jgi:hypothetical protein